MKNSILEALINTNSDIIEEIRRVFNSEEIDKHEPDTFNEEFEFERSEYEMDLENDKKNKIWKVKIYE